MKAATATTAAGVFARDGLRVVRDEDKEKDVPTASSKVTVPSWLVTVIVTGALAFLANFGTSVYWAGQMAAKQEAAEQRQIKMQADIERLTVANQDLRERLAAIAAAQRPR